MLTSEPITTFDNVLVANRGEIALRVIRAARALGLRTVAVYSDADRTAPHVRAADEAVRIGPAPAAESYLSIPALLGAAQRTGAQAIHPGYGFLSERADFARAVVDAGLAFVGPGADAMDLLGRKDVARALAERAGVAVVPSAPADDPARVPFPVLVKAVAGGGGKGMRVVRDPADLSDALAAAAREARAAFGDGSLLVERFVEHGRHVEVQVIADQQGTVLVLGDRDCSAQRRHQKVVEEAPAPGLSTGLRGRLAAAAVALTKAAGYTNAGTIEFLVEGDEAYFLEMNTRLQVEHPVTELVTGVDIVSWQFAVADGQRLPLRQEEIVSTGHAIEARVYAEDPGRGFLPQAGTATLVRWPDGVRVDAGLESGQDVGTEYDPLLGKVIAHGPTREAARRALVAALDRTVITGLTTNLGLLRSLVDSAAFRDVQVHTAWLDRHVDDLLTADADVPLAAIAAWALVRSASADAAMPGGPFEQGDGWRVGGPPAATPVDLGDGTWRRAYAVHPDGRVTVPGGEPVEIRVVADDAGPADGGAALLLEVDGRTVHVVVDQHPDGIRVGCRGVVRDFPRATSASLLSHDADSDGTVTAPMPGTVTSVRAHEGQQVRAGDALGVLEAMKMEFTLAAPIDGTVVQVRTEPGTQVARGAPLFVVEEGA